MTQLGPLSRADFARFAAATNDYNPIHVDEEYAMSAGLPSAVGSGLIAAALIAEAAGLGANLGRMSLSFRRPILPGAVLTCVDEGQGGYRVADEAGSTIAVGKAGGLA